jgi:CheY-like chemotaxis protein
MNQPTNPRVLFVDDDDLMCEMYARVLGRQFELRMANSGAEAIQFVQTEAPFAVIMSDMQMPGMNGIELLRRVRAMSPETSRILLTGLLEAPGIDEESDLAAVISKPCASAQVIEVLRRQVEAYESRKRQGVRDDT